MDPNPALNELRWLVSEILAAAAKRCKHLLDRRELYGASALTLRDRAGVEPIAVPNGCSVIYRYKITSYITEFQFEQIDKTLRLELSATLNQQDKLNVIFNVNLCEPNSLEKLARRISASMRFITECTKSPA